MTFVEFDFCLFVFYRLGRHRLLTSSNRNYNYKKQKNILKIIWRGTKKSRTACLNRNIKKMIRCYRKKIWSQTHGQNVSFFFCKIWSLRCFLIANVIREENCIVQVLARSSVAKVKLLRWPATNRVISGHMIQL